MLIDQSSGQGLPSSESQCASDTASPVMSVIHQSRDWAVISHTVLGTYLISSVSLQRTAGAARLRFDCYKLVLGRAGFQLGPCVRQGCASVSIQPSTFRKSQRLYHLEGSCGSLC